MALGTLRLAVEEFFASLEDQQMVGREVVEFYTRVQSNPGKVILQVEDLKVKDDRDNETVQGVTFDVKAGEIFGIAGVAGKALPRGMRKLRAKPADVSESLT